MDRRERRGPGVGTDGPLLMSHLSCASLWDWYCSSSLVSLPPVSSYHLATTLPEIPKQNSDLIFPLCGKILPQLPRLLPDKTYTPQPDPQGDCHELLSTPQEHPEPEV